MTKLRAVFFLIVLLFLNQPTVPAETANELMQDGNDFYVRGNFDQAIYAYTKAITIDPGLNKAYNNRGVTYAREGSMTRAVDDFTMAIANDPKDAEAYNNRGHAYAEQGQFTQAVKDYSQAIQNNGIYIKAYKNRAYAYYKLKDYDKAWADVFKIEELGGKVDRDFYLALRKASGKIQ